MRGRIPRLLGCATALVMEDSPLSLQGDLFYNRLTSGPNTFDARVNGKAALLDQTIGLTGSLVATPSRRSAVAPYCALGARLFTSRRGSQS